MVNIDIAMATYNGENYLREQIKSIQSQTYQNWTLYISDDASDDSTVAIIKEFSGADKRIKLINLERQGGVVANFNKAINATKEKYIALSDQDDVWPEDRLQILFEAINKEEAKSGIEKPLLIYSDLTLVDKNLVIISRSLYKLRKIDPEENKNCMNLLWMCSVYGCSTIMNRALLNKALPIPDDITMHDNWLALNAASEDGLKYLNIPTIYYRQHENNVTGGGVSKNFYVKMRSLNTIFKEMITCKGKMNSLLSKAKKIEGNNVLKKVDFNFPKNINFAFRYILPFITKKGRRGYATLYFIIFLGGK